MKVLRFAFVGTFMALSTIGALAPAAATLATNKFDKDHKVTICHATNSATNPYVRVTVDYNSIVRNSGHDSHHGGIATSAAHAQELKNNKQAWGDIIPAIEQHNYPGKNLTLDGKAILDNDCNFVGSTAPAPEQPIRPSQPANPSKPDKPDEQDKENGKVTLCHATRSATNPYVRVTVSVNAVLKSGHGDHTGDVATSYEHAAELKSVGKHWGDVIPAIPSKNYAGLNLAQGQSLLDNNCQFVAVAGVDDETPVVDGDKGQGGVVVSDEAAFTDQPRVAALPVTGGISTLLIPLMGIIAAGITYLLSPILRRISENA